MKKLADIIENVVLKQISGKTEIFVYGLTEDSREVKEGYLFAAISGTRQDGHLFIDNAISAGAAAIICEDMPANKADHVCYIQVENSAAVLGCLTSAFYGHPSRFMKIIGVTGTNGKTTIATLLHRLFMQLGYLCGLISTIEYKTGNESSVSTHTTPDAIKLNALLAQMLQSGCQYVFMEVSSHGLVQHRVSGIRFAGGVFSNISHDHLDFHHNFDNYLDAKKSFFDQLTPEAFALVNKDDRRGLVMIQNTSARKFTYAINTFADFKGRVLESSFDGLLLELDDIQLHTFLIGDFNASNLLAIYATAILLGADKDEVLRAISTLKAAEGRFDIVKDPNVGVYGIVDYAHTPDALEKVIDTINNIRTHNEKLITIIGCGGDRDKLKRPKMTAVACEKSDRVILTSDNPRTENPDMILADMKAGIGPQYVRKTLSITDRKEAIKTACMMADAGDIILLAGKGHEKTQEIKGVKYPFDDKEILRDCLALITSKN